MAFDLVDPRREPAADALVTRDVPPELHDLDEAVRSYVPDDRLVAAVNVSLAVGAPLLVTGEPGTGKTALAHYLRRYFRLEKDQLELFPVKSTSIARELLWTFDTVRYFHAGQDKTNDGIDLDKRDYRIKGPLWRCFEWISARKGAILLIDEIDKAPRDFPNDLLHELDQFSFRCTDTGEEVSRPSHAPPPLVIVTSNSERRLPEPFLRRCIFHHIELDADKVRAAVDLRMKRLSEDVRRAAVTRFLDLRKLDLRKPPSTAELFLWLTALSVAGNAVQDIEHVKASKLPHLGALIKDREDLAKLE